MMSKGSKSQRVQSNLLQQNCYVRDVSRCVDLSSDNSSNVTYCSLDEIQENDGIRYKKNYYPYPITPEYVKSFADSSDYRRDPANAIANGVNKTNISDCSAIQNIMNMDASQLSELYKQLHSKFSNFDSISSSENINKDGSGDV